MKTLIFLLVIVTNNVFAKDDNKKTERNLASFEDYKDGSVCAIYQNNVNFQSHYWLSCNGSEVKQVNLTDILNRLIIAGFKPLASCKMSDCILTK